MVNKPMSNMEIENIGRDISLNSFEKIMQDTKNY